MSHHSHVDTGNGCPKCAREASTNSKIKSVENFIKKVKIVHGDVYEYDFDSYIMRNIRMNIKCKKHGWFKQLPKLHIKGSGCSKCYSSKGETAIRKHLHKIGINFEEQYRINECRNKYKLPFDFAILNNNRALKGLIEFHGYLHRRKIEKFEQDKENYSIRNMRDQIKSHFCEFNRIPLLAIYDEDFDSINILLDMFLRKIRNKKCINTFKKPIQSNIFQHQYLNTIDPA